MSTTLPRPCRRLAAAALSGVALVGAAGCGSDDSSTSSGSDSLASMAPATSLAYVQATLRPDGDQQEAVDAVAQKVFKAADPGAAIEKAFDRKQGQGAFAREVDPWVGDAAAIAITGVTAGSDDPDVALIADAKDDNAQTGVDTLVKSGGGAPRDGTYKDIDYKQTREGLFGVVDDRVVAASTPASFRAVVDASAGSGLADNGQFKQATAALADGQLGVLYVDPRRAIQAAGQASPAFAQQAKVFESSLQSTRAIAAGLSLDTNTIRISAAALGGPSRSGNAAATVASLPAGSWAAIGLGDVGEALGRGLQQIQSLGASNPLVGDQVDQGLRQLQQSTGLNLRDDVISWMGDGGFFLRGSGLTDIGGALVVRSKDAAKTRATLAKAKRLVQQAGAPAQDLSGAGIDAGFSIDLPQSPIPLQLLVASGGDKFVVAVNRSALDEALHTTAPLSDDPAFKAAAQSLGDGQEPSFFVDVRTIVSLASIAVSGDPSFQQARPYLDAFTTVAAGGSRKGDVSKSTIAIGLR